MSTPSDAVQPADPADVEALSFIEDASGNQDPPPAIKGVRRLLGWILPANLAIFLIWGAVPGILLPQQITLLDPDPVRKVANLCCDNRKAATGFTCAGGLNCGIECQDIGLKRDAIDHADDVGNLA